MSKPFLSGLVFGLVLGSVGMGILTSQIDSVSSLAGRSVAECAVGQDFKLRDSDGIAQYQVTFHDDVYTTIKCVSNPPKPKQ